MRRANQTSFKPGQKRSPESIEKQRRTMLHQIKLGIRKIPKNKWTSKSIRKMVKSLRKKNLIKNPIGSKRIHHSNKTLKYWVVKTSSNGKWKYEHRMLMEKHLKIKLKSSEHIHHINHNTLDNRLENLKLTTNKEHRSLHRLTKWSVKYDKCIICFSVKVKHHSLGRCEKCYTRLCR